MEKLMRLPPGFRFHPTDEELVVQYLRRKALSCPLPAAVIAEIDPGEYDPWDLPGCHEGEERYFFKHQEAKYRKGNRSNRATRSGYWKSTGKDRPVLCSRRGEVVGMKKVLVFHQGKHAHGARTQWIMHEYRLASPDQTLASSTSPQRKSSVQCAFVQGKDWVACRIFAKKRASKMEEEIPRHHNNIQVRNIHVRFADTMNCDGGFGPRSPPSSCVTDLTDEECSNGDEASSKLFAPSTSD